ncbi:TetR family transcriptional regulator [Philodulcilactobacillus myokoensis]|uniref:TetR family transcriptional regulator n=1 Tax=Philodulcilactobacillus myokoensis TaxID=2929573 RepID=A0A9W6ESU4_9LACO|nr:TetR/AcrR family transcriptional regulator [Philodulcilactobacillus myokoensis]GLB46494.1 TetR family transcriptional regulator [Philodulcilactobacillus myokoensis]
MRNKYKTRDKIINGFLELLKDHSYQEITIKDICKKASVSRMTYYRNFHTKEDLINYHFNQIFLVFIRRLATSHNKSIIDIATIFFTLIKEDQFVMKMIVRNHLSMILLNRLKYYIEGLIDENVLKTREESSKLLVSLIAGGLTEIIITWTEDDMKESISSLAIFASKYMHFKIK